MDGVREWEKIISKNNIKYQFVGFVVLDGKRWRVDCLRKVLKKQGYNLNKLVVKNG